MTKPLLFLFFSLCALAFVLIDTWADRAMSRRVEALEEEVRKLKYRAHTSGIDRATAEILGANSEVNYVMWGTNIIEVSRK